MPSANAKMIKKKIPYISVTWQWSFSIRTTRIPTRIQECAMFFHIIAIEKHFEWPFHRMLLDLLHKRYVVFRLSESILKWAWCDCWAPEHSNTLTHVPINIRTKRTEKMWPFCILIEEESKIFCVSFFFILSTQLQRFEKWWRHASSPSNANEMDTQYTYRTYKKEKNFCRQ